MPEPVPLDRSTVVIIRSYDPHDLIYCENMSLYFNSQGLRTIIISIDDDNIEEKLTGLKKTENRIFCIVSISYYAFQLKVANKWINQFFDVPFVIYDVDLIWIEKRIPAALTDNLIVTVTGADALAFWQRYVTKTLRYVNTNIGHGPSPRLRGPRPSRSEFLNRTVKILMDANFHHRNKSLQDIEAQIEALHPDLREIAREVAYEERTNLLDPTYDVVEAAALRRDRKLKLRQLFTILEPVSIYHKLWRRLEILDRIFRFPFLLSGANIPSDYVETSPEKFCRLNMHDLIATFPTAQSAINTNLSNDCLHPRVLYAIQAGAAPILQRDYAVDRTFEHGQSAYVFDFGERPVDLVIEELLDSPATAHDVAEAANEALTSAGLWDHNFRSIHHAVLAWWAEKQH